MTRRSGGLLIGGVIGLLLAGPAAAQVQVKHVSEKTALASFVDVVPGARSGLTPETFLHRYGALFGVRSPAGELSSQGAMYDQLGRRHHTYVQVHRGVPVFGGRLRVHEDAAGLVSGASGEFFPLPDDLDTLPSVDRPAAAARAIEVSGGDAKVTEAELTIVDPAWYGGRRLGPRLVYRVRLRTEAGELRGLFVDAHSGDIIEQWPEQEDLLNRSIYVPNNSPCVDQPRFPGVLIRAEGAPPASLVDGNRAYDYLGDTYRYFAQAFGRDSLDARGLPLLASVGPVFLGFPPHNACPNAFWDRDRQQMLFCDGTVGDDITAHELTHGLTQHTAGLFYLYQPGMLNESFSDVFGEVVDLLNGDAAAPGPPGGAPP